MPNFGAVVRRVIRRGYFAVIVILAVNPSPGRANSAASLAQASGCSECHGASSIGPNYREIAARYRNDSNARQALISTIKYGGKDNWPASRGVPMPPFSKRLSDTEIAALVDWLMGL